MNILPSFIRNSTLWVNFFTLLSGAAVAQLIPLLLSPFIARLFCPADFGILGLFSSIVFPLSSFATGRFELAVLLPEKDKDSQSVIFLSLLMNLLVSSALLCLFVFASNSIMRLFKWEELLPFVYWIPPAVFTIALYTVMTYWFLRKAAYKASSLNRVGQTVFSSGTTILTGLARISGGLIIAEVIGRFVALIMTFLQARRHDFKFYIPSWFDLKRNLIAYRDFPMVSSFTSFLDTFSLYLPSFIVFSYFGKEVAGGFNFSRQMVAAPMLLIASTFSQLILRNLSEKAAKKMSIRQEFINYLKMLCMFAAPVFIIVLFAAPLLFGWIFGEQWLDAGIYSRILVLSFAIKFVVSPLSMTFPALNAVRLSSRWQIAYFISMMSLFVFVQLPILVFFSLFCFLEFLMYLLYLWMAWRTINRYESSLVKT